MFLPPKTKRTFFSDRKNFVFTAGNIFTVNRAFSRQKLSVLTGLLPFDALIPAAHLLFSYGRGTQIYGSASLCWVDKFVSWYLLLYKGS
jgi:hypothetical protein